MLTRSSTKGLVILGFSRFLTGILVFLFSVSLWSQVRIIQWTDAHSSIETISKQVLAIDYAGRDFLRSHPKGEVIVYVVGDFTSINAINNEEGGWSSFEALRLLRERGYTVLFTPGNHDAFDWTVKIDGAQLFLKQMQKIQAWGVKILVNNLRKKTKDFQSLTSPSYELATLKKKTHIVGLTLPILMSKSNLTEASAKSLFAEIEPYSKTFRRVFPEMARKKVEAIIFGVHQGHEKLKRQIPVIKDLMKNKNLAIDIPLMLGAHDHLVVSYHHAGTHFSNSGSYGSFNIIDINATGEVLANHIQHVPMTLKDAHSVRPELFQKGSIYLNDITDQDIERAPWLHKFHRSIQAQIDEANKKLQRVRGYLPKAIDEHKAHMKSGQSELGSLLAESLVRWARISFSLAPRIPVIALANSSSYRRDSGLPAGPIIEKTLREFYPFHTEATAYQLKGREIKKMYFSLRRFYANGGGELHSPQLNFDFRERGEDLEMRLSPGVWAPIEEERRYYVVFDGWLSEHRFGQGYRLTEWSEVFADKKPMAQESYQDLLVRHFPSVVEAHQRGQLLYPLGLGLPVQCRILFH